MLPTAGPIFAPAAFPVALGEVLLVDEVPVGVDDPVADDPVVEGVVASEESPSTRAESFASSTKDASTVPFVQVDPTVPVPDTKLTAAHCGRAYR